MSSVTKSQRVTREIGYRFRGTKRTVSVSASAGAGDVYVEISFGGREPSEVINVWDYRAGKSTFTGEPGQLDTILDTWISDQDSECDPENPREWVPPYLQNSGILPY